jgi:hypothetical protein
VYRSRSSSSSRPRQPAAGLTRAVRLFLRGPGWPACGTCFLPDPRLLAVMLPARQLYCVRRVPVRQHENRTEYTHIFVGNHRRGLDQAPERHRSVARHHCPPRLEVGDDREHLSEAGKLAPLDEAILCPTVVGAPSLHAANETENGGAGLSEKNLRKRCETYRRGMAVWP